MKVFKSTKSKRLNAIFTITLETVDPANIDNVIVSKLQLVDLAGSEFAGGGSRAGYVAYLPPRQRDPRRRQRQPELHLSMDRFGRRANRERQRRNATCRGCAGHLHLGSIQSVQWL